MEISPQPNLKLDETGFEWSPRFWWVLVISSIIAGLTGGALMRLLHLVEQTAWHYQKMEFLAGVAASSHGLRIWNLALAGALVGVVGTCLQKMFGSSGGDSEGAIWFHFGQVPFLSTMCKAVLAIVTVGLGTSLGRESPIKQAGGAIASLISRWGSLTPAQKQLIVACGVGAGMASAYNVPLGGGLFAAEVLIGSMSLQKMLPALVASVVATAASWALLPMVPIYNVPEFPASISLTVWAILAGPVFGFAAVCMVRATAWAEANQQRGWHAVALPIVILTALGALAIPYPQLLGNGKDTVDVAFNDHFPLRLLLILPVLKLIVTSACLRSGARGGLFTPTMTVGALIGGALGQGWLRLWPQQSTGAFAVVGSCAVLAAATRGPLSALVLVLELTRHVDATMAPMLLATAGAVIVSGKFESRSIYSARAVNK
jgi:CIC family chloride channel protein